MSEHLQHPDEGPCGGIPPESKAPGRGYFFYVAVFFILIALICYVLSWTFNLSPTSTPPTTSTTAK